MTFKPSFKYLNKFFAIGKVQDIKNQLRTSDGSSFGVDISINTGTPGGFAHVRVPNNKNVPLAYDTAVEQLEIGGRFKAGFDGAWLRLEEREHNGRTYRSFTQFNLPSLATTDEHDRLAGKLIGELVKKEIVDVYLQITLLVYETDKNGAEVLFKGESQPRLFKLVARGKNAEQIYDLPEGTNLETSVRFYNTSIYNDYGDIEQSLNEVRVEQFKVHGQPQAQTPQPMFTSQPQFTQQQPTQTMAPFPTTGAFAQPQQPVTTPFPTQPATQSFPGTGQFPFPQQ